MLKFEREYFDAKDYVIQTYYTTFSMEPDVEDDYFGCPGCTEPLYAADFDDPDDWTEFDTGPWSYCPVCGFDWYKNTYNDYEEEEEEYYDEV